MKFPHREPYKVFFETLGNKTRWDIVHFLKKRPSKVTRIAEELGYEQSLVSHHLKRLVSCGFVQFIQNGNERIYDINKKEAGHLLRLLDSHISKFCKKVCGKCN